MRGPLFRKKEEKINKSRDIRRATQAVGNMQWNPRGGLSSNTDESSAGLDMCYTPPFP